MKIVELSVAGKTFVAGEYLALHGGPALLLATEPRFVLTASKSKTEIENIFHPQSPAGQFWNLHSDFFKNFELKFQDPYQIGGFGASSAQFALLHSLWQLQDAVFTEAERFFDWHLLLQDYRKLHNGTGLPPSGADVVAACAGGLTLFDRNNGKLQTFSWPFMEIEFFVAHTGAKLATHEHLETLQSIETSAFEKAMEQVRKGLELVLIEEFLAGLRAYREVLQNQNRVTDGTRAKVQALEAHSEVLFAKGCGAMGSDVILVFCEKVHSQKVRRWMEEQNLKLMADSSKIGRGLQIQNLAVESQEVLL